MKLVAISMDGRPEAPLGDLPAMAKDILNQSASLYSAVGYEKPWVGYFAVEDGSCIGFCAFKSAPVNGTVEIAYATLPQYEGIGIATNMAKQLIGMARENTPEIIIRAQTLPEENASTTILRKLGFRNIGAVIHPEDGKVWEWRLQPAE